MTLQQPTRLRPPSPTVIVLIFCSVQAASLCRMAVAGAAEVNFEPSARPVSDPLIHEDPDGGYGESRDDLRHAGGAGGGACAAGDCCLIHASGGCECSPCCQCVCTADPFCCDEQWDDFCAAEAVGTCAQPCPCDDGIFGDQPDCSSDQDCPGIQVCIEGHCGVPTQLPAGFEIVPITQDYNFDNDPRINRCGEIVFSKRAIGGLDAVYLYDNGATYQLTDHSVTEWLPDINDNSTITWTRQPGPQVDSRIWMYQNGQATELFNGLGSRLNNLDHMTFVRFGEMSCLGPEMDILLYDGDNLEQLTDAQGLANQSPWLNDSDDVVWVQYDFCASPDELEIMLSTGGVTMQLTDEQFQPGPASINNVGIIAWAAKDMNNGYQRYIEVWNGGVITLLTQWGGSPFINNEGDIAFSRWDPEAEVFYAMLYRNADDTFYTLTDGSPSTYPEDINDWGEVTLLHSIGFPHYDVSLLRRIRTGEADFDGDVDQDDYEAFAGCFTGPGRVDGLCDCRFLDIDHDGDVDCDDWQLFLAAWTGPPAAPPSLPACGCPADLNGDGTVGPTDLALVLGAWGANPSSPADLNGDGAVNAADLAMLLGAWGPC